MQNIENEKGWSSDQYEAFKDRALNNSIIRKTFSFSDLTLISDKLVGYAGVEFEITENAFKALVKLLGLSNGFMDKIATNISEKVSTHILQMMKAAISQETSKNSACMLIDKNTTKIVNFIKSGDAILSNNAFFSLFEDCMNNHSGMILKNMSITQEGNVEISVLNNNWEFNIGGLKDEFFKSGLVFINTPDSTIINPFNERLVCTNGMTVADKGLSMVLKHSDANSVNGFFDLVRNLKDVTNFEQEFKLRINRMMKTIASYSELLDVRESVEYEVLDMANPDTRQTVEDFIPTTYVKQAFLQKGIDLNEMDKKTYKKIKTMLTVWELVNKLTDLSSHPFRYGLQLRNANSSVFQLQRKAGELSFKKEFDLEGPEQAF